MDPKDPKLSSYKFFPFLNDEKPFKTETEPKPKVPDHVLKQPGVLMSIAVFTEF